MSYLDDGAIHGSFTLIGAGTFQVQSADGRSFLIELGDLPAKHNQFGPDPRDPAERAASGVRK